MNNRTLRDNNPIQSLLRFATLIVIMMAWTAPAMAQGTHPYAGVWYLNCKKNTDYYMVPAKDPQVTTVGHVNEDAYFSYNYNTTPGDPEMPFITTYHTERDSNSVWLFVPVIGETDYYYIVHAQTGKYVKYYQYLTGTNARRKYVHLETIASPGNTEKFEITTESTGVKIKPKNNNTLYFNVAGENQDRYNGGTASPYYSGLIGGYDKIDDNSIFILVDASSAVAPIISDLDETTNTFTITSPASTFNTIHYTTDGSTTPTATVGNPTTSGSSFFVPEVWDVQAVGVFESVVVTAVSGPKHMAPFIPDQPTFTVTCDNKLVLSCANMANAHIYYTVSTNGTPPDDPDNNSTPYTDTITLNVGDIVKAIAYNPSETVSSTIGSYTHQIVYTEAPELVVTSATIVTITGPVGSTIYYTTNGVDPVIGNPGVISHASPVEVNYGGVMMDIRAIAKVGSLEPSCVAGLVTMGKPDVTFEADECTESFPRGNVIKISVPEDGSTVWYAVTAGDNSPAPDIAAIPNPYTQYTGEVVLDDLDGSNTYYTVYTVHAYAKSSDGSSISAIESVSRQMKTGGKPELTPPVGSNPVVLISGGTFGDVAVCTATGVDTQQIPVASDGTAEYTISPEATGTLNVVFKHGDWLPSCEANYTLPGAPKTPTFSQDCADLLSLACETPMADIHYTTDNTEPTLASPTYIAGCLDTLTFGTTVRAKAFIGFRASEELSFPYTQQHSEKPQFFVEGVHVVISVPGHSNATIYYNFSTNGNQTMPSEPDEVTIDDYQVEDSHYDLTGITIFSAIAVYDGLEPSCPVRVVTREGYSINSASDLSKLSTYSDKYLFVFDDIDASGYTTTVPKFTGVIEGNFHTISGLQQPLIDTATNAVIHDLTLADVTVDVTGTDADAGAFARVAKGNTRIYNCGIIDSISSVSGTRYVGGLVGLLADTARVINCFSYAKITGGTHRAGIVGYNNVASTSGNLKTMVMNCMFYGDISTEGDPIIYPVYGGQNIHNKYVNASNTGLNNYCYFYYHGDYVNHIDNDNYHGSLGAEERFLNRFEFFRQTLNSTRNMAAYYISGNAKETELVAKWVLDKSIAPYPILKAQGYYPSIINHDAEHAVPIDPDNEHYNEGRKLGTLTVIIQKGSGGAVFNNEASSITTAQLVLNITDKDFDHDDYSSGNYDFNYKKVQLPYYNQVGTGNYTNNCVVTGWKIVKINGSATGTGSFTTENYDYPNWNFVDRACSNKDLYSVSGRVFSQGAYWEVPDGVTSITIEPYWAKAAYLSDAYYDRTYSNSISGTTATTNNYNVTVAGVCPTTFNEQTVYNLITGTGSAIAALNIQTGSTVYDYAVVLVGNYHQNASSSLYSSTENKLVTFMSADLDGDCEPDNTLFYYHNARQRVAPVRFDFLNMPGIGMVKRTWNSDIKPEPGIFKPAGWFEITNTVVARFGQFEYCDGVSNSQEKLFTAPLILQGGIYEQFVSSKNADAPDLTPYLLIGGNAWFKNFANGCHTDKDTKTHNMPINVTGGDYEHFYLSGIYRPSCPANAENAECYMDGGRFGEVAGAGMQLINGNVTWLINAADIEDFFAGGINAAKAITGHVTTTISNSRVTEFYGGPKFGDMKLGKTVTTTASNCHFGLFFGAGYGGTAFNKWGYVDASAVNDAPDWAKHVQDYYERAYNSGKQGISTSYEYEFILHSDGQKTVTRFFVNYASLSLASTQNVNTNLTGCTMVRFYGGGRLGAVNGDVNSVLTDCTVEGDVFGSGYSAETPTVDVMPKQSFIVSPKYNRRAGVFNDAEVEFPDSVPYLWKHTDVPITPSTTVFEDEEDKHYILTNVNVDNLGAVLGNATLTINGNSVVKGDVYGGGALSSSNTNNPSNITRVNINGGSYGVNDGGTITGGNIYGGGMGNEQNAVTEGTVEVNIGNNSQSANSVVINGSVYGCNNANGSPKDNVTVNVYTTKHNSTNIVTGTGFAISQVFGGGNQAHYTPTSADKKTTVHIHNCDNTIQYVYGGGNAANVGTDTLGGIKSATHVIIDGGRIEWVFGGGNGAGVGNPGANIYNDVNVEYHAGDITYLFGGSNEKGLIGGSKNVSILNDLSCAIDNHIAELYGGNNKAPITGGAGTTLTMPCTSNPCSIGAVFGGSRQADISGDVVLTIEGGEYDYVFGGNNISGVIDGNVTLNLYGGTIGQAFGGNNAGGSITGKITVNMLDQGECPLVVNNIYGGGKDAAYTPNTVGSYPEVNLIHGTVSKTGSGFGGNVYGGGYGSSATVTSNPVVNIGYDEGMSSLVSEIFDGDFSTSTVTVANNVYGGGEAANVNGNITVNIQQESSGITATTSVTGDIYGGGNLAHVTGSSNVNVLGGTVSQDVYGGGALADVGTSDSDSTIVTISGGTVRNVYGGGLGQASPEVAALVKGKVKVKALGGTISNMFGCNNVKGAPQSTVQVLVNDTTTAQNLTIANVFGGGNLAAYNRTPDVDINIGTVTGRVFGGGNEAGVSGGDVTMSGGTVNGGLYGGCNTSGTITNNVTVYVTGGTIGTANAVNGAVYGGGLGENTKVKGNVTVTIDGGTLNNDVYGGSAKGLVNCNDDGTGATEGSKTDVILNAGTINGSLYGGGHGINNANAHVWGPVQVTVNGGTVTGSVYGCNNASGAPQSTVKVDIYDTDHPGSGYALGHVFGGGNQADYTAGVPTVKVHGCDNSINYVYGGGNAAAVKGTDVTIYGGNSIAHVFGGCYGAEVTTSGTDVKIYGGTIDTIYGGNNESGSITGDIKVTVNKQPEHANDSCAMHIKEVYGGGNKAASNAGQITIAYTGYNSAERINYVYGGANRANVTGPINLTIREGRIDNVFGGNNNSGSVSNDITVNIEKDKDTPARVWEIGNVFGGGNLAAYSGTPNVYVKNGTVTNVFGGGNGDPDDSTHELGKVGATNVTIGDATTGYKAVVTGNVYGGGNAANVTGATSINLTQKSTVNIGVYGGCNTKGNVGGDITVTVNCDSIGSRAKLNTLVTSDVFGGGYGQETSTSGDVEVNINGGIIYGDVYGGSALGEVNASGSNTTTVNVNGGTLETKTTTGTTPGGQSYFIYHGGNVYGGGLGRKADDPNPAISAEVNGKVFVNIGSVTAWDPDKPGYTLTTAGDATIKGNIYGCNNTYGSPQDDVVVNVYQTAHTPGVDGVDDEGYALANVFGGGNEADFTATGKTTTVNIYSCDNTIQRTFGGSNAAASNSVTTMIQGGRIHEAYGGGNGEVQAANVNGSVTLAIHGGTIGQSFSGSNQNGVISETSTVTIDDAGCGGVVVDEHFCGGNFADWEGNINATIECTDGMHVKRLYGGCKQANVVAHGGQPGNVHLTVKGGTYEYIYGGSQGYIDPVNPENNISADIQGNVQLDVYGGTVTKAIFGGSHILGKIQGTVIVNVEDRFNEDSCPLDVSEADVYGGGNQADYPGEGIDHGEEYNYPQVNIKNATVKNVFGGGLEADVIGNPQIKIKKGSKIRGNVYGGGNMGEVDGDPKVIINGKLE